MKKRRSLWVISKNYVNPKVLSWLLGMHNIYGQIYELWLVIYCFGKFKSFQFDRIRVIHYMLSNTPLPPLFLTYTHIVHTGYLWLMHEMIFMSAKCELAAILSLIHDVAWGKYSVIFVGAKKGILNSSFLVLFFSFFTFCVPLLCLVK